MDFRHIWIKFCSGLFSTSGLVVSLFGFLAVANAYVMGHNMHWIDCNKCQPCNNQDSKFLRFYINSFHNKSSCEKTLGNENGHLKFYVNISPNSCSYMEVHHFHIFMMLAFYVGYTLSHLLGFVLVKNYGGKRLAFMGLTLTALLAWFSSDAIELFGARGIIFMRLLMGLSEGLLFPAFLGCASRDFRNSYSNSREQVLFHNAGYVGILMINFVSTILVPILAWSKTCSYILNSCAGLWFISSLSMVLYDQVPFLYNSLVSSPSYNFDDGSFFCYNATILSLLAVAIHHDWTQSLIITEVQRLMDNMKESNIRNNYYQCGRFLLPFVMTWFLSKVAETLGSILVMTNILSTSEARNLMEFAAFLSPKICSDYVTCLMSTETKDFLTTCNCAISVLCTHYMSFKINSMDVNNEYAVTFMNFANDIESIVAIMSPYMDELSREEGPFEYIRSIIRLLNMLFSAEFIPSKDEPILQTETFRH